MIENILTYLLIIFLLVIIVIYSSKLKVFITLLEDCYRATLQVNLLIVIILISEYNLALGLLCAIVFIFMVNDVFVYSNINEGFYMDRLLTHVEFMIHKILKKSEHLFTL